MVDLHINQKSLEDPCKLKRVFLIFNYIEFDLRKLMEMSNTGNSDEHIITITYNILCGLNFMHSANLMHRDIKPENILLNEDCTI